MESLAGQVEKLKEVGKALVSKKESEIQTLKKEIAELNEDKNVRYHRTPPLSTATNIPHLHACSTTRGRWRD
jgi:hypothetical protein